MYLLILEDGEIFTAESVTDDDKAASDNGILDIIDVSGDVPKQYSRDEWVDIRPCPGW